MKIVDLNLGPECDFEMDLTKGALVIKLDENTPGIQGNVNVTVPVTYFLDKLAEKFNSTVATAAISGVKALLSAV